MRSSINPSEFFEKMKKKPKLQAVLDNIENITEAEIENLDQPKWIRQELMNIKIEGGNYSEVITKNNNNAIAIAQQMIDNSPQMEDPKYKIYRYQGENWFPKSENFSIEFTNGDLIIVDGQTVQLETTRIKMNNKDFARFLNASTFINEMTKAEFNILNQKEKTNKYLGQSVPDMKIDNTVTEPNNVLSNYGVRIQKINGNSS